MLYYTADWFILQVFLHVDSFLFSWISAGSGCVIFGRYFVVIAEHFYKIAAGRKTAAVGDLADLQTGGLQKFPGNLQTLGSKIFAETYSKFMMEYSGEICRTDPDMFCRLLQT